MIPEPDKMTVLSAIQTSKPKDWEHIFSNMKWDCLMGCWLVIWCGMTLGIEIDGSTHT